MPNIGTGEWISMVSEPGVTQGTRSGWRYKVCGDVETRNEAKRKNEGTTNTQGRVGTERNAGIATMPHCQS